MWNWQELTGRAEAAIPVGEVFRTGNSQIIKSQVIRTATYEPGASSITGNPPVPGIRASTLPPPNFCSHFDHSGHQEPGILLAVSRPGSGGLGQLGIGPVAVFVGGRGVDHAGDVAGSRQDELYRAAEDLRGGIGRFPGCYVVFAGG